MKWLRMQIHRTINGNHTHYEYPDAYDPKKIKFGPIYEREVIPRAEDWIYIIIGVDAADFLQFSRADTSSKIAHHIFATAELTKDEVIAIGSPWVPTTTKISDEATVIALCQKMLAGGSLTPHEAKQLDANEPELGIKRSKTLAEKLTAIK